MRCLVGEAWRGATSVSIKKEADSRPSEGMVNNSCPTRERLHTKGRNDGRFLSKLGLETLGNP